MENEVFETMEITDINSVQAIQKAEIDVQIATAHAYPRSMTAFKKRALEMVSLDEETAQSCIYRRPVGKDGKTGKMKYAEGKSVRMAEIVGSCFGNLRIAAMIIEQTPRQVKARGMAHDLESNYAASSEVIESTVDSKGNPYSERMRVVVAKAALAKARRDATFQVVPAALCKTIEEAARKTAIGTIKTIDARRQQILDWINKLGINATRVWTALGIDGIEDVGLEEMGILTGIKTSIRDNETTINEAFPEIDREPVPMPEPLQKKKTTAKKTDPGEEYIEAETAHHEAPANDRYPGWPDLPMDQVDRLITLLQKNINAKMPTLMKANKWSREGELLGMFGISEISPMAVDAEKYREIEKFVK